MGTVIKIDDAVELIPGTMLSDVFVKKYKSDPDTLFSKYLNTRLLRAILMNHIFYYVKKEGTVVLSQFFGQELIPTAYHHLDIFAEIDPKYVIVTKAFKLDILSDRINDVGRAKPFIVELLDFNNISKSTWDDYIESILFLYDRTQVKKIVVEDIIGIYNLLNNDTSRKMIKDYFVEVGYEEVIADDELWMHLFKYISTKYWTKITFSISLNDFDIYNMGNRAVLNLFFKYAYDLGMFDEVIIKMNYLWWTDDFAMIFSYLGEKSRSSLLTFRFDTELQNEVREKYFYEIDAQFYGDEQCMQTDDDYVKTYEIRLPVLFKAMQSDKQTYGIQLIGDYLWHEGGMVFTGDNVDYMIHYYDKLKAIQFYDPYCNTGDIWAEKQRISQNELIVCIKNREF